MIILGIDPGTRITGYGVVHHSGGKNHLVDFGCIRPRAADKLTDRYLSLFEGLEKLLEQHKCEALAVETQYVSKNPASALKLGMARGVAILAAKRRAIPVYEYSPTHAKKAVVGSGSASKHQVQHMIRALFHLKTLPEPEDAADALAIALCHAHSLTLNSIQNAEI